MITWLGIIGMILNVSLKLPAVLEKHFAANVVESPPLFTVAWRSQFVFWIAHRASQIFCPGLTRIFWMWDARVLNVAPDPPDDEE
jgi:hypothetical protein